MFMFQDNSEIERISESNTRIEVEQNFPSSNPEIEIEEAQEEDESREEEDTHETVSEQLYLQNYSLARDRQRRTIVPPSRFSEADCISLALNVADSLNIIEESNTFDEAINGPNSRHWIEAMNEEMRSLEENGTWILKPLPKGYKPIASKWIYKVK